MGQFGLAQTLTEPSAVAPEVETSLVIILDIRDCLSLKLLLGSGATALGSVSLIEFNLTLPYRQQC